ncbi:MAG: hypothetical protein ACQJCO_04185 [cyanobacterium endosymbiont of Rhopalodia sterrenbergii]
MSFLCRAIDIGPLKIAQYFEVEDTLPTKVVNIGLQGDSNY